MRIDGRACAEIGDAVASAEDRLAVIDDKNGDAGSIAGLERCEDPIDLIGCDLGRPGADQNEEPHSTQNGLFHENASKNETIYAFRAVESSG
jgi:hypothetical protein